MNKQFIEELQQAENEFKQENYSATFNIFFELAHKNCVQAQYRLAQMCQRKSTTGFLLVSKSRSKWTFFRST